MGLFSSKKVHTVDTTVARVVEDDNLPDTAKTAMLKAVFEGSDITYELKSALASSSVFDFNRMHKYGETTYTHGLPNHQLSNSRQANVQPHLQTVINAMVGRVANIEYMQMGPMDYTHATFQILTDQYDYNAETNEIEALSAVKGTTVWLSDITPVYDNDTLAQAQAGTLTPITFPATSGYTPERQAQAGALGRFRQQTKPLYDGDLDFEVTIVSIIWINDEGNTQTSNMTFAMEFDDIDADYFQARFNYQLDTGETITRFLSYLKGEGSFPVLDNLFIADYVNPGTYFPFVFFRTKDKNATAEQYRETEDFLTAEKLVSYLGIDYIEMGEAVHGSPDIGDVDQAVMMMGVPLDSTDETELKYLFEFWNNAATLSESTSDYNTASAFNNYNSAAATQSTYEFLRIYDADFSMRLRWRNLSVKTRAGRIGTVNTVTGEGGKTSYDEDYTVRNYDHVSESYTTRTIIRTITADTVTFRKQITEATYKEVVITDPTMFYDIYKGKGMTAEYGDDQFLVPIDRTLAESISTMDREYLYLRSLHFVFNSHVTTKTKWYASTAFKIVLVIVAIVITVMSGGSASPLATALVAAGITVTTAMLILIAVVEMFVMQAAFDFAAKELGAEVAQIIAIALIIYGGYSSFQSGSISGAPWAQEMFTAANGLMSGAQAAILDDINDIVGELADLTEDYEGKMDALADINEELSNGNLLDPLTFVGQLPTTVIGESPTEFYDRTVHSGNIGTLAYDMLHSHYEIATTLPTISDSLKRMTA